MATGLHTTAVTYHLLHIPLENFTIILIAILLEALPFVIIGVVLSGIIEEFVPSSLISKVMPKRLFPSIIIGALLGIVIPLCECVSVVVVRRLLTKGVPIVSALTYMLSGPVVNPVTALSTITAYSWHPQMVLWRCLMAIFTAIITGLSVKWLCKEKVIRYRPSLELINVNQKGGIQRLQHALVHASNDFSVVFGVLLFGATLAALFKAFAPTEVFIFFKEQDYLSIIVFAILSVLMSLCSEADAFVATSLNSVFDLYAQLAFLTLGPMLDLKLMAIYKQVFTPKVFAILCTIPPIVIILSCFVLRTIK